MNYKYQAFISYRHADNKQEGRQWATWLHQAIETYEIPKDLVGTQNKRGETIPSRIFPIFRDEEELPTEVNLGSAITYALDNTKILIVLCSPNAVQSKYVDDEIDYFKKQGGTERILAVIIDGEPNSSWDKSKHDLGFRPEDECFPKPLQYNYDKDGNPTNKLAEPIAADLRITDNGSSEQGWTTPEAYLQHLKATSKINISETRKKVEIYEKRQKLMLLKIISGILGVSLGELTQRDKEYQLELQKKKAKNLRRWLVLVATLAIIAVSAGVFAYFKQVEAVTSEAKTKAKELQTNKILQKNYLREAIFLKDSNRFLESKHLLSRAIYHDYDDKITFDAKVVYNTFKHATLVDFGRKERLTNYFDENNITQNEVEIEQKPLHSISYPPYEIQYRDCMYGCEDIQIYKNNVLVRSIGSSYDLISEPIISDKNNVMIFSGATMGSGNYGAPIILFKPDENRTHEYVHNYNSIVFLSEDENLLISYSLNDLYVHQLKNSSWLFEKLFYLNKPIHGVVDLDDKHIAYWYEDKIHIINVYTKKEVLSIKNFSRIADIIFDSDQQNLIVESGIEGADTIVEMRHEGSVWNISTLFPDKKLPKSFEIENEKTLSTIHEEIQNEAFPNILYYDDLNITLKEGSIRINGKENNELMYLKHNFYPSCMTPYGGYETDAILSQNKSLLASWSCVCEDPVECRLFVTDIENNFTLFEKMMPSYFVGAGFLKNYEGIFIKEKVDNNYYVDGKFDIKFIPFDIDKSLENKYYILKTEVETGTKLSDSGELQSLTKQEWIGKKLQYEKIIKISNSKRTKK